MAWTYMLANRPYGTLYVGSTVDLSAWLEQHRSGHGSKFTERYGLTSLVYAEFHEALSGALQRERTLKRWRRDWKIALIMKDNPEWEDLSSKIG